MGFGYDSIQGLGNVRIQLVSMTFSHLSLYIHSYPVLNYLISYCFSHRTLTLCRGKLGTVWDDSG